MIKTRAGNWTVLAAVLLCFAACGKKDVGVTPQPVMPAPNAVEKVPAQAEVKASSGPIELSFLLHKTQIKAGDSLWEQIRLRNVGKDELVVVDQVFHDPRELRDASRARYGIYLEALGPEGQALKVEYSRLKPALPKDDEVSGLLEVEGPQEQSMLDGWHKQGLGQDAIDRKLLDFNMKKRIAADAKRRRPVIRLLPGQEAETKSAFFYSITDELHGKPVPVAIGDFAQVDFFHFDKPGRYKIRAAYNHAPTKRSMEIGRQFHHGPDRSEVLILTPWITVSVLP